MISAITRQWSRISLSGASRQAPRLSKRGVVAKCRGDLRFGARLRLSSHDARDHRERTMVLGERGVRLLHRQLEHRAIEIDVRVADGELGRVHADGQATSAGVDIVPRQLPLTLFIQPARSVERERVRGDDLTSTEVLRGRSAFRGTLFQNFPSRASNLVGLPRSGPSCDTQSATRSIISSTATAGAAKRRTHSRRVAEQRVVAFHAAESNGPAESLAEFLARADER